MTTETTVYPWPPYVRTGAEHIPVPRIGRRTLRSGRAMFLLTLGWARGMYFSSAPVDVTADRIQGGKLRFQGGLPQIEVDLEATPGGDYSAPRVSMAVLPLGRDPVHRWVTWGHRLDQATAELAWWVEGTPWWQREVLVRGRVETGAYGGAGQPMLITIAPEIVRPGEDAKILTRRITVKGVDDTANYFEEELGKPYPIIIGAPGWGRSTKGPAGFTAERLYPGSRALRWTHTGDGRTVRRLMLAGHHMSRLGPLRLYFEGCVDPADDGHKDIDGDLFELTTDGNGVPITLLDLILTGGPSAAQRTATDWFVCFRGLDSSSASYRGIRTLGLGHGAPSPKTVTRNITFADSGTLSMGVTLTPGARVLTSTVVVNTGFDGALPIVDIGDNRNSARHLTAGSLASVGTTTTPSPDGEVRIALDQEITVTPGGSTVGDADISIRYQPAGGMPIQSLRDVLLWALERSRARVDLARWTSAAKAFRPLDVDVALDDPEMDYWTLLQRHILPILPITPAWGPNGMVPVVWPWRANDFNPVTTLSNGKAGVWRVPEVRFLHPAGEIITEVQVAYGWDPQEQVYRHTARNGRDPEIDLTWLGTLRPFEGATGSAEIRSRTYPGPRVAKLESRIISSETTANWLARWWSAIYGGQHLVVDLECRQEEGALMFGDTVAYNDAGLNLTNERAVVIGRRLTDRANVGIRLAVLDLPGSRRTETGPNANKGERDRTGKPTPQ